LLIFAFSLLFVHSYGHKILIIAYFLAFKSLLCEWGYEGIEQSKQKPSPGSAATCRIQRTRFSCCSSTIIGEC